MKGKQKHHCARTVKKGGFQVTICRIIWSLLAVAALRERKKVYLLNSLFDLGLPKYPSKCINSYCLSVCNYLVAERVHVCWRLVIVAAIDPVISWAFGMERGGREREEGRGGQKERERVWGERQEGQRERETDYSNSLQCDCDDY